MPTTFAVSFVFSCSKCRRASTSPPAGEPLIRPGWPLRWDASRESAYSSCRLQSLITQLLAVTGFVFAKDYEQARHKAPQRDRSEAAFPTNTPRFATAPNAAPLPPEQVIQPPPAAYLRPSSPREPRAVKPKAAWRKGKAQATSSAFSRPPSRTRGRTGPCSGARRPCRSFRPLRRPTISSESPFP